MRGDRLLCLWKRGAIQALQQHLTSVERVQAEPCLVLGTAELILLPPRAAAGGMS